MCKVASRCYSLLQQAHPSLFPRTLPQFIARNLIGASRPDLIVKRHLSLQDFLMFSEHQLSYHIMWLDYASVSDIEQAMRRQKDDQYESLIKCAICHKTARGLLYTCPFCSHGGHY
jgi:hypothetical protein